jgi:hypothetical protein
LQLLGNFELRQPASKAQIVNQILTQQRLQTQRAQDGGEEKLALPQLQATPDYREVLQYETNMLNPLLYT